MHKMIKVSGGKFLMGASEDDAEAYPNERPQREVEVKDFELESHPVTNLLWWEVMGGERPSPKEENFPKVNVSFYDCARFMNARSLKDGLQPVYTIKVTEVVEFSEDTEYTEVAEITEDLSANGYRFPSEEEWEYAARAGTTGSRYGDVDDIAVYSTENIREVGTKKPNAWGFFDMLGLVWEWTGSKYRPNP
jgi:formylglycine-generating enzyme required for sulfatase activity